MFLLFPPKKSLKQDKIRYKIKCDFNWNLEVCKVQLCKLAIVLNFQSTIVYAVQTFLPDRFYTVLAYSLSTCLQNLLNVDDFLSSILSSFYESNINILYYVCTLVLDYFQTKSLRCLMFTTIRYPTLNCTYWHIKIQTVTSNHLVR